MGPVSSGSVKYPHMQKPSEDWIAELCAIETVKDLGVSHRISPEIIIIMAFGELVMNPVSIGCGIIRSLI